MAIKVTFSQGQTEAKASALHQWDYGQQMEIEAPDLPTAFEVHFACQGMNEAIIHSCTAVGGVATVDIPNRCLEQSNSVTAWVYEIYGSTGTTIKTITIPVISRTRPSRSNEIPQDISDRYTELITEVEDAVGEITNGNVMVARAAKATSSDRALTADSASTAAYAQNANYATSAGTATSASKTSYDHLGDLIATKYASFKDSFTAYTTGALLAAGTYQFKILVAGVYLYGFVTITGKEAAYCDLGWNITDGQVIHYRIGVKANSTVLEVTTSAGATITPTIYYRRINAN
jgi:hypothetical protein